MSMKPGMKMMLISKMGDSSTGRSDERSDPRNMPGRTPWHDPHGQYARDTPMDMTEDRYYDTYEPAEGRRRGGNGRFIRGEGASDIDARMIGYDREDDDMPSMKHEPGKGGKLYAKGSMMYQQGPQKPTHQRSEYHKVDEQMADNWVRKMENADGTSGGHYKIEQSEQLRKMYCMECDKWEFYVALNMMYSDYCEVARQMGMDRGEYYAQMARAFLCDDDAGDHKLQKYFTKVVR